MAVSRRRFIGALCAGPVAVRAAQRIAHAAGRLDAGAAPHAPAPAKPHELTLDVNGHPLRLSIEPRVTLLDALRERAGLTGAKKGCDHGQCGACTVHVDGRRVLSCLTLAVTLTGRKITTVEGLAANGTLTPLQQAFIDQDGFQCGYCTSDQLMSAAALMSEPCGASDDDVRECMSGNLCRCGAYNGIVAAIQQARGNPPGKK